MVEIYVAEDVQAIEVGWFETFERYTQYRVLWVGADGMRYRWLYSPSGVL